MSGNTDAGYPKCVCPHCRCGKRSCFICGQGECPLNYIPCKIHDWCCVGLEGCLETSVTEDELGRHYWGPLDNFSRTDSIGEFAKCEKCRSHPMFRSWEQTQRLSNT